MALKLRETTASVKHRAKRNARKASAEAKKRNEDRKSLNKDGGVSPIEYIIPPTIQPTRQAPEKTYIKLVKGKDSIHPEYNHGRRIERATGHVAFIESSGHIGAVVLCPDRANENECQKRCYSARDPSVRGYAANGTYHGEQPYELPKLTKDEDIGFTVQYVVGQSGKDLSIVRPCFVRPLEHEDDRIPALYELTDRIFSSPPKKQRDSRYATDESKVA